MDTDTLVLLDENDQAFAVVSSDDWSKVTAILRQKHSLEGYDIVLRGVNGGLERDDYAVLISVNDKATALKNMKRITQLAKAYQVVTGH